jgi:hypothetical protein
LRSSSGEKARLVEIEEAFEAEVDRMAESTKLAASGPEDTRAPAPANEAGDDTVARARGEQRREEISASARAYAETGNPLYVWDALSMLCVPSIAGMDTPDCLLPGWCVAYLGRAAETLMGLPPPGVHPVRGMAEQAPAVSKALGLSRQGWDAFAEWQKDRESERDAEVYDRVRALGISDKDAAEAATSVWNLENERSVRRRLRRGRRAKPRPLKPAP